MLPVPLRMLAEALITPLVGVVDFTSLLGIMLLDYLIDSLAVGDHVARVVFCHVITPILQVVSRNPALASSVQVRPQPPVIVLPLAVADFTSPCLAEHVVGASIESADLIRAY